jgi:murein DD-endopeptidase MepM/ murein hydrolase activator NlpD
VAFFALLHDQDLNTPIEVFARDPAGNEASTPLDHRAFARPFARSRIQIDDRFMQRVVPAIASASPGETSPPTTCWRASSTSTTRCAPEQRVQITSLAHRPSDQLLFRDAFQQLGNSQVESLFADHRTYLYQGREIDQQVHLGFDLAVTAQVPIVASQRGRVLFADYLGIYGNTVSSITAWACSRSTPTCRPST